MTATRFFGPFTGSFCARSIVVPELRLATLVEQPVARTTIVMRPESVARVTEHLRWNGGKAVIAATHPSGMHCDILYSRERLGLSPKNDSGAREGAPDVVQERRPRRHRPRCPAARRRRTS